MNEEVIYIDDLRQALTSIVPTELFDVIMTYLDVPICSICGYGYVAQDENWYGDVFTMCSYCDGWACRDDCSTLHDLNDTMCATCEAEYEAYIQKFCCECEVHLKNKKCVYNRCGNCCKKADDQCSKHKIKNIK